MDISSVIFVCEPARASPVYTVKRISSYKSIKNICNRLNNNRTLKGKYVIGSNVFGSAVIELVTTYVGDNINKVLTYACKNRDVKIIRYLITLANIEYINLDYDQGYLGACIGGHIAIAQWMIDLGAKLTIRGFALACREGHPEIIEWMRHIGLLSIHDLNIGMLQAAKGGHAGIVKMMLIYGANDLDGSLSIAKSRNRVQVIDYLQSVPKKI